MWQGDRSKISGKRVYIHAGISVATVLWAKCLHYHAHADVKQV